MSKIRPQILAVIVLVLVLAAVISLIGWKMDAPEIVTGVAGASITGIIALAGKIIEREE